jgi:uncharacterized protein YbjT (DUF2867 family)
MIFITGVPGVAAGELVQILTHRRVAMRIGVSARRRSFLEIRDDAVQVDFASADSLRNGMDGCAALFLLTPFSHGEVELELRLVDAARAAGVRKIVKQSVPHAASLPGHYLAQWHTRIEEHIRESGFLYCFLRPQPFMQDFAFHLGPLIRRERRFVKPGGEGAVSYIDARDVAAIAAEALLNDTQNGQALLLTGPEALTNREVAERLSARLGEKISYEELAPEDTRGGMRLAGLEDADIETLIALSDFTHTAEARLLTNTVASVLGRPPTSFEAFIDDYRRAFEPEAGEEETGTQPFITDVPSRDRHAPRGG